MDRNPCPKFSPLIMFTSRTVVISSLHAALLETYDQSRMDRDRSCRASVSFLYLHVQSGKPRLTFVSEGNPLRRLLLGSNNVSIFTVVSPLDGLPVTPERGTAQ